MRSSSHTKAGLTRLSFYVVAAFTILCGMIGGSAKADEPLVIPLRLCGVAALIALILIPSPAKRRIVAPLDLLLAAFAAIIALQLIPLPPGLWTKLPGHTRFTDAAVFAGVAQPWRPISINSDLTANSLIALLPAVVVLVGYAKAGPDHRISIAKLFCLIGLLNAIVSIIQLAGGSQSQLFYYSHATSDNISGMFANRNHFAVYVACLVPLLAFLYALSSRAVSAANIIMLGVSTILLLVIVLVSGSRSGTAAFLLCSAATVLLFRSRLKNVGKVTGSSLIGLAVVGLAVIYLAYSSHRATSIDRLQFMTSDEMRIQSLPIVIRMTRDYLPFGTGFGTFDTAFRIYEPDSILSPFYFNNAHDDWLETVLTGGLPGLAIMLLFFFWYVRTSYRVLRFSSPDQLEGRLGRVAAIIIAGVGVASFSDYPLRTPMFTAFLAGTCCLLADVARSTRREFALGNTGSPVREGVAAADRLARRPPPVRRGDLQAISPAAVSSAPAPGTHEG